MMTSQYIRTKPGVNNKMSKTLVLATRLFSSTARKLARVLLVERENLFIRHQMAQKTITSFFKAPQRAVSEVKKSPEKKTSVLTEESKESDDSCEEKEIVVKRKNSRRISDSDDDEQSPKKEAENVKEVKEKKKPPKNSKEESKTRKRKASVKKENKTSNKKAKTSPDEKKQEKLNEEAKKQETEECGDEKEEPKENKDNNEPPKFIKPDEFNPNQTHYNPVEHACWKKGEKVPYAALARTLAVIEETSARLKMIEILANYFRSVITLTPEDLLPSIYLSLNQLAPAYEGLELRVGDTIVMKAVAQSTGRSLDKLKAEVTTKGDLGLVAESSRSNQRMMFQPARLTVSGVFKKLKEIAEMVGNSSMNKKTEIIQSLLVACRGCESRFVVRSVSGKLRIGLAEQSLLVALAQAVVLTSPENNKKMNKDVLKKKTDECSLVLKTTYCECPNYDKIIDVLLQYGVDELPNYCKITPGIPLKPMLAQPTNGVEDVLRRFDTAKFTCEYKYDGERAQIHVLDDGQVFVYSRNQENNTSKYPDIIKRIPQMLKEDTKSCIIDAEAVAWDPENKQIRPFQVLSTRKRKDANESDIKVQVCVFAFDLLYLNGESLVKKPFSERRELLHKHLKEEIGEFVFVQSVDSSDTDQIAEFLDEAIKGNCEGLMVKTLDVEATYEIAKRSRNWLKLKKDYLDGIGDTLDLVVIGGYNGKGKRTGNYGGFLLACYDNENEEFQTICKIGTGFSDEILETHSKFFKEHVIEAPKPYYCYDSTLVPDVWFDAVQVWEVKCADISISPIHKAAAGLVDESKGLSLRFPRFLRVREDKTPEDATNATQVSDLYRNQEQIKNQQKSEKTEEDDEY